MFNHGKYYTVHNMLSFKIVDNARLGNILFNSWDVELRGLESTPRDIADLTIFFGKFNPDTHDCSILDDDYYVKDNYIYCCRDSSQYAKWRLELSGFEQGDMTVRIHSNLLGKILIPELIINPLIWFKLNERGCPVIHGSVVSRDGLAYVFAGRGAAGKSTIALHLVEDGFKFLSEHFAILHNGDSWSLPTPLHIMDYNLSPFARKSIPLRFKACFHLKKIFQCITGKRLATKILPVDILPANSLTEKAKLHSLFLLLPRDKFKVTKIERAEMVSHLVANQKLEEIPFARYFMEYAYLFPRSKMATHWIRYADNLSKALASARAFYRVEVPRRYDKETLKGINQLVNASGRI